MKMMSESVSRQLTVSGISRAENLRECQELFLDKDVGSPDSVSDSDRDHLRLRKLLVSDRSKHCNKVFCPIVFNSLPHNLLSSVLMWRVE